MDFYTVREMAKILKVEEKTITKWARNGDIPSYKFGGVRRFDKAQIAVWIEGRKGGKNDNSR